MASEGANIEIVRAWIVTIANIGTFFIGVDEQHILGAVGEDLENCTRDIGIVV